MKRIIVIIIAVAIIAAYFTFKDDDADEAKSKKPIATFIAEPEEARINETATGQEYPEIRFDASESNDPNGNIEIYSWNFGEGNFTNQSTPYHNKTYQKSGKFEVTLTVFDNDNNQDESDPIEIFIDYHKENSGELITDDEEIIPFPVNIEVERGELLVNITNTDPNIVTGSSVEIIVEDANNEEIAREESNGITGNEQIEITLNKGDLINNGEYKLKIKCTEGSIRYDSTIDIYYK